MLASAIFSTSCYLHKWLTLNIKKIRQFRENQRKEGRQAALHDILLDVFHCGDCEGSESLFWLDSSDCHLGDVCCCARPEMQFIERFTQKMCYFTVLRHIFFFLTNIICVIRVTIQTGSKDNRSLAIDFNT